MPCPIKLNNLLLNLSERATLGTEEGGRCREVETRVNVWKLQGEWVQALAALIYGIPEILAPKVFTHSSYSFCLLTKPKVENRIDTFESNKIRSPPS